ncbi:MAG: sigma 54-interacting transcriptional regulator [Desulfobacteraceae bacterium]|jgi:transcriptional regulator with GAF, ATPase, and Fis domain
MFQNRQPETGEIISRSDSMRLIFEKISKLQRANSTNVLICGETGTGKELIAKAIHKGSRKRKGPFISINCATIPKELAESSLFGHVQGAFTGASSHHKGYFELADKGTLFLDERSVTCLLTSR